MNVRLEVGQRTQAVDLAAELEGQEGTYIAQQAGQSYLVVAKTGHSITSLRPIGRRFIEVVPSGSQENWTIEKISNREVFQEDRQERQQTNR